MYPLSFALFFILATVNVFKMEPMETHGVNIFIEECLKRSIGYFLKLFPLFLL